MIAAAQIHSIREALCILALGVIGLVIVYYVFYRGHP